MSVKPKKITVSFKNTTKDVELYLKIQELEEKSQSIKDILYDVLVKGKKIKST
ncbi:circadian clock-controlled protein [Clostridium botulinum]|uniref:Circadian clock-controlled protein n=1 Tax=Clostridium botulinum TaxID=1491 RepID=A0A846JZX4_CLOBO|nr:circadian clock-controlled protein [Clostridium botulinum]NFL43120.1 circadian clock-controlled protein [Clostridium botulinum]NFN06085.1 circadian clock-controlled protein [Clostridium botulinum]NFN36421.1 circadian clock-controlled protein [Clostridium botulinum]HBJ1648599.1 circadian clock-controlled protein [Clostridium botulinum]